MAVTMEDTVFKDLTPTSSRHLATSPGNIPGLSSGINIDAAGHFETTRHRTSEESKYSCPSQYDVILSNDIYNVQAVRRSP